MERACGILMHITSLPSPYGIGTLGKAAYEFADFLKEAGHKYWQVLPVGPTSIGDSPYQSFSSFAGNPYMIDLDMLEEEGLLKKEEYENADFGGHPLYVDYGKMYENRFDVLKKAYERFDIANDDYVDFCVDNAYWLDDYAVFMTAKKAFGSENSWAQWKDRDMRDHRPIAIRAFSAVHAREIGFYKFMQYMFFKQWKALKEYVNDLGIKFIGDAPIYVALDSADAWGKRELFKFDDSGVKPTFVAGCPPDYFSEDGQLWGNPLYDWDKIKKTGYKWWIDRLSNMAKIFDMIRIDHFRGFEAYYAIPYGDENARGGHWKKGPDMDFINAVKGAMGDFPIIAEDLGLITDEVRLMLDNSGYPGMKVLQFAFSGGSDNAYLPHNHVKNCVVYSGTHDNDTLLGWFEAAGDEEKQYFMDYTGAEDKSDVLDVTLRALYSSVADLCVVTMQDLLSSGSEFRMNTPSTLGNNWKFRAPKDYEEKVSAKKLNKLAKIYDRALVCEAEEEAE